MAVVVMDAGHRESQLTVRWFAIRWLLTRWFESLIGETVEITVPGGSNAALPAPGWLAPGRYMLAGVDIIRAGAVDLAAWQDVGATPTGPAGDRLVLEVGEMSSPGAFGRAIADMRVSTIRLALDLAESFRATYTAPWWQRVQLAREDDVFAGLDVAPMIVRMVDDVSMHPGAPRIAGSPDVMRAIVSCSPPIRTVEDWDRLAATVEDVEHRADFIATCVLPTAAELGLDCG